MFQGITLNLIDNNLNTQIQTFISDNSESTFEQKTQVELEKIDSDGKTLLAQIDINEISGGLVAKIISNNEFNKKVERFKGILNDELKTGFTGEEKQKYEKLGDFSSVMDLEELNKQYKNYRILKRYWRR